ncbi:hypothetical protein MRX96_005354 [Rhipicephalus microplus]
MSRDIVRPHQHLPWFRAGSTAERTRKSLSSSAGRVHNYGTARRREASGFLLRPMHNEQRPLPLKTRAPIKAPPLDLGCLSRSDRAGMPSPQSDSKVYSRRPEIRALRTVRSRVLESLAKVSEHCQIQASAQVHSGGEFRSDFENAFALPALTAQRICVSKGRRRPLVPATSTVLVLRKRVYPAAQGWRNLERRGCSARRAPPECVPTTLCARERAQVVHGARTASRRRTSSPEKQPGGPVRKGGPLGDQRRIASEVSA